MNDDDKIKPKNVHPLAPQWPFRMIISGPSGSGKSNLMLNLVTKYLYFDKCYIFAKDAEEDKYSFLINFLMLAGKQRGEKILEIVSDKLEDVPDLMKLDKKKQHLFIFDDMITTKNQKIIEELSIRGRKRNASIIYLTQVYHEVPKNIRKNCNYIAIFNVTSKREILELQKDHAIGISKDEFVKMYNSIIDNDRYGFLFIDRKTEDKKMIYRSGLDQFFEFD
jgi:hypothetical protein